MTPTMRRGIVAGAFLGVLVASVPSYGLSNTSPGLQVHLAWLSSPALLRFDVEARGAQPQHFYLPVGTRLSSGNPSWQDFVLAESLDVRLDAGEASVLHRRAFCVHPDRGAPPLETELEVSGLVSTPLRRLLVATPTREIQRLIWEHVRGREPLPSLDDSRPLPQP